MLLKISSITLTLLLGGLTLVTSSPANAEEQVVSSTRGRSGSTLTQSENVTEVRHSGDWKVDDDGVLQPREYEIISLNGSITRALCPYTCGDRQISRANCKEWRSAREPNKCYVQDRSIPSRAIE